MTGKAASRAERRGAGRRRGRRRPRECRWAGRSEASPVRARTSRVEKEEEAVTAFPSPPARRPRASGAR